MKLLEYKRRTEISSRNEVEKAKLLCYYLYKEQSVIRFSSKIVSEIFIDAGLAVPNFSRLKKKMIENNLIKNTVKNSGFFEFNQVTFQELEISFGSLWANYQEIITHSEVLDESKFITRYKFIENLVKQVNATYAINCFDATAVMMRRLFEVCLILLYRHLNIDDQIKDSYGNYLYLDSIIKNAISNKSLNLSRIRNQYHKFQMIGNHSAHRIEYVGSKKDIDDILIEYRTAIEEIYIKAGI